MKLRFGLSVQILRVSKEILIAEMSHRAEPDGKLILSNKSNFYEF